MNENKNKLEFLSSDDEADLYLEEKYYLRNGNKNGVNRRDKNGVNIINKNDKLSRSISDPNYIHPNIDIQLSKIKNLKDLDHLFPNDLIDDSGYLDDIISTAEKISLDMDGLPFIFEDDRNEVEEQEQEEDLEQAEDPQRAGEEDSLFISKKVEKGDIVFIENVLRAGINLKTTCSDGSTLLHIAAEGNHIEIVKLLLEYGSDPNQVDMFGDKAIHLAEEKGFDELALLIRNSDKYIEEELIDQEDVHDKYVE